MFVIDIYSVNNTENFKADLITIFYGSKIESLTSRSHGALELTFWALGTLLSIHSLSIKAFLIFHCVGVGDRSLARVYF